jgi:hypothetical protein
MHPRVPLATLHFLNNEMEQHQKIGKEYRSPHSLFHVQEEMNFGQLHQIEEKIPTLRLHE